MRLFFQKFRIKILNKVNMNINNHLITKIKITIKIFLKFNLKLTMSTNFKLQIQEETLKLFKIIKTRLAKTTLNNKIKKINKFMIKTK